MQWILIMRLTLIIRLLIIAFALVALFISGLGLLTDSTMSGWLLLALWLSLGASYVLSEVRRRILKREADQA